MLTLVRRFAPVLVVSLLFLVVGCDTLDPGSESVTLFVNVEDEVQGGLRFSFDADNAQVGRVITLQAARRVDLGGFLDRQGFSKAEVLSAQVESASLEVEFPIDAQANFIDEAVLQLQASGASATTVASQTNFPNSREGSLTVQPNQNIASFVARSDFGVQLLLTPASLQPGTDYEVTVAMRMRIEVEGV